MEDAPKLPRYEELEPSIFGGRLAAVPKTVLISGTVETGFKSAEVFPDSTETVVEAPPASAPSE